MSDNDRRDFSSLITKLKSRFGSENKAEVFRTQLKTRIRLKGESIPELAQSIRKLTRKAYPTANSEVVDALALDSFIDALNESDIRLRLREVSPKSIFEAEQIALRMEAHRLADRQRSRLIGSVHESSENVTQVTATPNTTQNKPYLNKPPSNPHFQDQKIRPENNRYKTRQNFNNRNYHENRNNPRYNVNQPNTRPNNRNQQFNQGNEPMSRWRDHNLTGRAGPRLH